ncbi:mechanosensitive ion channel family protein [Ensifer adhaerens]|uniref:cyclic nucleotide-binding domain-containing protein n=1 Tax=Ensifer adhaerens TaxID=106592 RepID=UPI001CC16C23|nr:mechanosensitive ion channel family protein [Ensifer adhaerens]MBZ7924191.1 mechanosensitive ion channel family protein [Ensifer adhaerens]UAX96552.1 mechanosensitive ion channel family protein [Ensifer adhaerens]UAY04104.1 mechanosensitive ion channel family protein [Ensifer adhaerens]UAY12090.1 mechanosensitive ion channel family protein [Ensifer adhaerens]
MWSDILQDPIFQFASLVILSATARLIVGNNPTLRLLANITFFALLTVSLLSHGLEPYAPDVHVEDLSWRVFAGIAKSVWWIGGAMVLVSSVRLFLILERKPREGRLLQDLVIGAIYLGAGLSIVGYVFSAPIGTLIATSGVFAIVLGLALQSTLNDVFSGVALNLGRPYTVGDWIVLDEEVQGRVIETNWRSTHLLNGTNDVVIVPNSVLAKRRLTNLTSLDETHGVQIRIRVLPTRPPAAIEETMREVLLSSNLILKEPAPSANIVALDGNGVEVELSFRVAGLGRVSAAKNEIFDLAYRHVKAGGLQLSAPTGEMLADNRPAQDELLAKHPGSAWRLLNTVPLFATLSEEEKEMLAESMTRQTFRKGTVIAAQDTSLTSLLIVRSGVVVVERDTGHEHVELNRLAPGDLFGERGVLMGALEPGNIKALTFVIAYEIAKDQLAAVMLQRPSLADELGIVLSRRLDSEKHLFGDGMLLEGGHPSTLTAKIRHLFQIQHARRHKTDPLSQEF